jgi:hypothetical protein
LEEKPKRKGRRDVNLTSRVKGVKKTEIKQEMGPGQTEETKLKNNFLAQYFLPSLQL